MTIQQLHQAFLSSSGICTDTRKEVKDTLFVALKGEHFDGNRFVPDALEKGCLLAITDRTDLPPDPRLVVVPSALEALQQLAHFHRMKQPARILAITGSNGKTTTKELAARVLETTFSVACTRGNLNNHIGVPLTLLELDGEEVAVVEMGANHPEEIAALCEIAAPGAGLITNVGKAHLEGFGSLEGVLRAKTEMYQYLAGHGGSALVDGTDHLLMGRARELGVHTLIIGPEADLPVDGRITAQHPFLEVELQIAGTTYPLSTSLVGAFNLQNIILAAGVGLHFGVPPEKIARAIAGYVPVNNRSQFVVGERNRVIMDAYNANPSSMRGAIEGLLAVGKAPLMLILGQMAELGDTSAEEHEALVEWIRGLPLDRVLLVGQPFAQPLAQTFGPPGERPGKNDGGEPQAAGDLQAGEGKKKQKRGEPSPAITVFKDRKALEQHLEAESLSGYHILVKGSRVNELERILPLL